MAAIVAAGLRLCSTVKVAVKTARLDTNENMTRIVFLLNFQASIRIRLFLI